MKRNSKNLYLDEEEEQEAEEIEKKDLKKKRKRAPCPKAIKERKTKIKKEQSLEAKLKKTYRWMRHENNSPRN